MVKPLDANVLIALAGPVHIHHQAARDWFILNRDQRWATCSFTEAAFVRISSNPRVFTSAASVAQALLTLQSIRALPVTAFCRTRSASRTAHSDRSLFITNRLPRLIC